MTDFAGDTPPLPHSLRTQNSKNSNIFVNNLAGKNAKQLEVVSDGQDTC